MIQDYEQQVKLCQDLEEKCRLYREIDADDRQYIFLELKKTEDLLAWIKKLREEIMNLESEIDVLMMRPLLYANDDPIAFGEDYKNATISCRDDSRHADRGISDCVDDCQP